jgi:hypothetical protein
VEEEEAGVAELISVELQARRLHLVPVALQLRRPPVWGKMRSGVGV